MRRLIVARQPAQIRGSAPVVAAPEPAAMAALLVTLRAREAASIDGPPSRLLHAAVHRSLERIDPTLSARIHDEPVKPFTLSPFRFAGGRRSSARQIAEGELVSVGMTVLERATLDGLLAALTWHWREEEPLALDWQPFTVETIAPRNLLAPGGPPLVTYAQLREAAEPATELALRFVSPVVFRNKGSALPPDDPWRLFQSYLRRWEAFSDVPLPGISEETVRRGVRLRVNRDLQVRRFDLGLVEQPGFVGEVRCAVGGDAVFRREIGALADYARYCGTGAKTAFGMGQTEVAR